MRIVLGVLLAVLLVAAAAAQEQTTPYGSAALCTSGCTTGRQAQWVMANGASRLVFVYTGSGTTNLTVQQSIDNGTTYLDVAGCTCTGCTNAGVLVCSVPDPVGRYAVNIGTCTSCTYSVRFAQTRRW